MTVAVNDPATLNGTILGIDASQDLAVLKMCCSQFVSLKFGKANNLREGTRMIAIGYPLGISGKASVTERIVSTLQYDNGSWIIQKPLQNPVPGFV
ncbi:MAG TPA: hypothetical protein EYM38_00325 [Dehalococcoidia bacterium]|nr:hypothetical protein [Dehalococcoidia bacterium]